MTVRATDNVMSPPLSNSNLRSLAAQLIAFESTSMVPAGDTLLSENDRPEFRVTGKLRGPLSKLAGIAGYRVLLARALTVAKSQDPSLGAFRVNQEARLEVVNGPPRASPNNDAGVLLIAQLLGLLSTFIGDPLTMVLIVEAWPSFPAADSSTLEKLEHEPRR